MPILSSFHHRMKHVKSFSALELKALMKVFFIAPQSRINVNLYYLPVYVKKMIKSYLQFPFLTDTKGVQQCDSIKHVSLLWAVFLSLQIIFPECMCSWILPTSYNNCPHCLQNNSAGGTINITFHTSVHNNYGGIWLGDIW